MAFWCVTYKYCSAILQPYALHHLRTPCRAATCLWAGIQRIVYGVGADDFSDTSPNMIEIRYEEVMQKSPKTYAIESELLLEGCKQLHKEFPLEDL